MEKKEQLGFSLPSATVLSSQRHLFALFSYLAQGHLYTLLAQPDSFQVISEYLFIFFLSCYKSQLRLNFFECNARYVFEALFNTEINILILEYLNLKDQRLFVKHG